MFGVLLRVLVLFSLWGYVAAESKNSWTTLYEEGKDAYHEGRTLEAIRLLRLAADKARDIEKHEPGHVEILDYLGGLYLQLDRPKEAAAVYEEALTWAADALDPESEDALLLARKLEAAKRAVSASSPATFLQAPSPPGKNEQSVPEFSVLTEDESRAQLKELVSRARSRSAPEAVRDVPEVSTGVLNQPNTQDSYQPARPGQGNVNHLVWITVLGVLAIALAWFWSWSAESLPPASLLGTEFVPSLPDQEEQTAEIEESPEWEPDALTHPQWRSFDEYTKWYHRRPDPFAAPRFLREGASELKKVPDLNSSLAFYFFYRVATIEPGVIPEYEHVLERHDENDDHDWLATVVHLARGGAPRDAPFTVDPRFPTNLDVLDRKIQGSLDLDYLWVEYFITGDSRVIERLIEVLHWPDRTRFKLENWLRQDHSWIDRAAMSWKASRLEKHTRIQIDLKAGSIITPGDLDSEILMDSAFNLKAQDVLQRAVDSLPFPLSPEDVEHMQIKGATKWSLASACQQHEDVRRVCAEKAPNFFNEFEQRRLARLPVTPLPANAECVGSGRVASNVMFHGPPLHEVVNARTCALECALTLVLGLAYLDFGGSAIKWVLVIVDESITWSIAVAVMLLLVGTMIGAFRQLSSRLLSQAGAMVLVDNQGKLIFNYIGDVPGEGWQASPWVRTRTWLLVLVTTVLGALIAARLLQVWLESESWVGWFFLVLAIRWFISWLPTRTIPTTQFNEEETKALD